MELFGLHHRQLWIAANIIKYYLYPLSDLWITYHYLLLVASRPNIDMDTVNYILQVCKVHEYCPDDSVVAVYEKLQGLCHLPR